MILVKKYYKRSKNKTRGWCLKQCEKEIEEGKAFRESKKKRQGRDANIDDMEVFLRDIEEDKEI